MRERTRVPARARAFVPHVPADTPPVLLDALATRRALRSGLVDAVTALSVSLLARCGRSRCSCAAAKA
eukprot:5787485-Alexandrium_andersonii.AAC.1